MKYKDPDTGDFIEFDAKTGDTLPVGSEVSYDGNVVPGGWEEVIIPENTYSSTEVQTSETWIDGKPIYRKTFEIDAPEGTPSGYNPNFSHTHEIENVSKIWVDVDNSYAIKLKQSWGTEYDYIALPIAYPAQTGNTNGPIYGTSIYVNTTILRFDGRYPSSNLVPYKYVVTLLYTKTTD